MILWIFSIIMSFCIICTYSILRFLLIGIFCLLSFRGTRGSQVGILIAYALWWRHFTCGRCRRIVVIVVAAADFVMSASSSFVILRHRHRRFIRVVAGIVVIVGSSWDVSSCDCCESAWTVVCRRHRVRVRPEADGWM